MDGGQTRAPDIATTMRSQGDRLISTPQPHRRNRAAETLVNVCIDPQP